MKVTICGIVDLGEHGSEVEQLADAQSLAVALAEAIVWHGSFDSIELLEDGTGRCVGLCGVPAPVAVAGVEWGGK